MTYRNVDLRTSVDPNTGERITPEEFLVRGHVANGEARFLEANRRWEAREPADVSRIGLQFVKDIDTYRTVAGDVANGGEPVVIKCRRQHREFLKRNGYVEHGNELPRSRKEELPRASRIQDIRRAIGE